MCTEAELHVLAMDDSIPRSEAEVMLEFSTEKIERALRSLEKKGAISVEDQQVTNGATTL